MSRKVKPRIACPHCGAVYVLEKSGEGESRAEADEEAVAEAEASADREITRFSRGFWALFWRCYERGVSPDPVLTMFRIRPTQRLGPDVAPLEAEEARLVQVPVKSELFAQWRERAIDRFPEIRFRFPEPDIAEWAWVPPEEEGRPS